MATQVRYERVATAIIRSAYRHNVADSRSLRELLESAGTEEEIDHILCDDSKKQSIRLESLEKAVLKGMDGYEKRRVRCPLIMVPTPGSFGFPFSDAKDGLAQSTETRFRTTPLLQEALFDLSPTEFEQLCGKVLTLIGCTQITVTSATKDNGVDAIASLPLKSALIAHSPLHRVAGDLSFVIYLQAKRYSLQNPVGQEETQELQGSWISMRNGFTNSTLSSENTAALNRADFRAADPVLLILMTTGRFSSGALNTGLSLGMILLDGEQIAQLLLESGWFPPHLTSDLPVVSSDLRARVAGGVAVP